MSLKMTEADWQIALEVFRACLPARGAKAKDDRMFLEALRFFVVHNITWRALPERFGHWNSVWKRFDRLSKAGVFEDFFALLAGLSDTAHLVQMFDSAIIRAHVSAAGAKGGKPVRRSAARPLGGGFGTKIHLKTDFDGLPLAFDLTGGEASDSRHFETLMDLGPDVLYRPRFLRHPIAIMRPAGSCPSGRVGTGLASGGRGARSASIRCRFA